MPKDTSMGGAPRRFESTLWSVVTEARDGSREALTKLIGRYWKPIYCFVRRCGRQVEEAKDLTQSFFTHVLGTDVLRGVSKEKGKFRSFILACLKNFMANEADRARAQKRGGGKNPLSLDFDAGERDYQKVPAAKESPDQYFKRQWALTLLSRAFHELAQETDHQTFEAIQPHLVDSLPYKPTAAKLNTTESKLTNMIHKFRTRFRDLLRIQIAESVSDSALVQEELSDLFDALRR